MATHTPTVAQTPGVTQSPSVNQPPPNSTEDLWSEAVKLLRPEDDEQIHFQTTDKLTVLDEVLTLTKEKREQCKDRQWKYRKSDGSVIVLRDVFDKMVKWLNKLEKIGDFVAQLDSVHLALPWACIKFFLQISVSDSEKLSAVYDGIEMITNLIGRYAIFEDLYLREASKASDLLKQAIIKLYASVLTYLAEAKRYYGQNTAKRIVKNVLQITDHDVEKLTEEIRSEQVSVDELARLIDAECLRKANDEIKLVSSEARKHTKELRKALVDLDVPRIHDQLSELTKSHERSEKLEVLKWIEKKIRYAEHHQNVRSCRLEGSGVWMFDQPQYIQWRKSASSSLLWLHGNPGSGKSRLVSLLVDTLRENHINPQAEPLAYVYCARNAAEPERGEPAFIIRSILRQLSCPRPNMKIQGPVARKYEELQEEGFELRDLTLPEAKSLIIELLENSPATIIIDALDECIPDRRYQLLDTIDEVLGKESIKQVKIVVSSRENYEDISRRLDKPSNFSIDAGNNKSDIERFVQLEVARSIEGARLLNGTVSPELRETLINTLTDGAQGMFLWVALQLQNLCSRGLRFENEVLQELRRLPKELKDTWSTIYKEVNSAGDISRRIANTALQWLLCAQGRLSSKDFVIAVSFDGAGKVLPMDTPKFLDICGNLVVLDTELDIFRFTHLSVREFLQTEPEFAPNLSHATAAEICLNTLLTSDWLSSEITWQKATLYQYATLYWASHIERCGKDYTKSNIGEALTQLFTWDQRVTPWFAKWLLQVESASQTLGWDDPLKDKIEQSLGNPETCLFTACIFGFTEVVKRLSQISPPAIKRVNAKGATGLHLASQFGHPDIVITLLNGGAEIDAKDEGMETALIRACSAGQDYVVSLLLERGADRKAEGKRYGTALQAASLHGHKSIVERLITGVDIDAVGGQFGTALQAASLRGHEDVVKLLIDKGAEVNAPGGDYTKTADFSPDKPGKPDGVTRVIEFLLKQQSLLEQDSATRSYQEEVEMTVQLLLDGKIDINVQGAGFGSALQAASRGGHEQVVRALLEAAADFNAEGGEYGTALQAAAVSGSDGVVQLLLDAGADVNAQSGVYNTALQAACRRQHETIISMLLNKKADVNALGGVYGSALQAASRTGSQRIIKLLLDRKADVNAQGGTYGTALQAASAKGFDKIVQMLLDRGADVNLNGGKYGTSLQGACGGGHVGVVRELVERRAKFDASLQIASLGGHDDIVLYLLENGADPNTQGKCFGTAVQAATAAEQEKVVQLLLDRGAHANDEGSHFGSALAVASAIGNRALVQLLLEKGADPGLVSKKMEITTVQLLHSRDHDNHPFQNSKISPLECASAAGHDEIVQMLLDAVPRFKAQWQNPEWHIKEIFGSSLEMASSNGHLKVVQILLDSKEKLGLSVGYRKALQNASGNGHEDVFRLLLEQGATKKPWRSRYLVTLLQAATKGNHEKIVRILLGHEANVNQDGELGTVLHIASYHGFENLARLFLDKGADPTKVGKSKTTPLLLASYAGHYSVVQLLLQYGANPNVAVKNLSEEYLEATNYGTTLQAAAFGGHENIVRLLLDHSAFDESRRRGEGSVLGENVNDADNADCDVFYSPPQSPVSRCTDSTNSNDDNTDSTAITGSDDNDSDSADSDDDDSADEQDGNAINVNKGTYGTALQAACFKGNEVIVRMLLDKGADANIKGGEFGTALQAASFGGFEELVRLLLESGADIHIKSRPYGTALQAAASQGRVKVVQLLIDAGADVQGRGGEQQTGRNRESTFRNKVDVEMEDDRRQNGEFGTALHAAAFSGNVEIVRLLLENGADVGDRDQYELTPLHRAANQGHTAVVELLLSKGVKINENDRQGRTAIRWVANYGYEKILGLSPLGGARMDVKDIFGKTAMHRAAYNGHTHVLQKLVEHGLDVDEEDASGQTPLSAAIGNGKPSAVRFLLESGASVKKTYGNGRSVLHYAAEKGQHTVIRPLLEGGANIEARNNDKSTALHTASSEDKYEVPYVLLLYGADVMARGKEETTALHIAVSGKSTTVLTLLLVKGADINATDSKGTTPLHVAARSVSMSVKIMEILLDRGANIEARDKRGRTPLHLAAVGCTDNKLFLLDRGADMDAKSLDGKLAVPKGREPKGYKRQKSGVSRAV